MVESKRSADVLTFCCYLYSHLKLHQSRTEREREREREREKENVCDLINLYKARERKPIFVNVCRQRCNCKCYGEMILNSSMQFRDYHSNNF
jgi:hypothetical protein